MPPTQIGAFERVDSISRNNNPSNPISWYNFIFHLYDKLYLDFFLFSNFIVYSFIFGKLKMNIFLLMINHFLFIF